MIKDQAKMQRNITLAAFAARRTDNGVKIKEMGQIELKLSKNLLSHTRGTVTIKNKTLPIVSCVQIHKFPQRVIDENSCILLIADDPSFTTFKLGILVNDITEITKVAHDFI